MNLTKDQRAVLKKVLSHPDDYAGTFELLKEFATVGSCPEITAFIELCNELEKLNNVNEFEKKLKTFVKDKSPVIIEPGKPMPPISANEVRLSDINISQALMAEIKRLNDLPEKRLDDIKTIATIKADFIMPAQGEASGNTLTSLEDILPTNVFFKPPLSTVLESKNPLEALINSPSLNEILKIMPPLDSDRNNPMLIIRQVLLNEKWFQKDHEWLIQKNSDGHTPYELLRFKIHALKDDPDKPLLEIYKSLLQGALKEIKTFDKHLLSTILQDIKATAERPPTHTTNSGLDSPASSSPVNSTQQSLEKSPDKPKPSKPPPPVPTVAKTAPPSTAPPPPPNRRALPEYALRKTPTTSTHSQPVTNTTQDETGSTNKTDSITNRHD